MATKDTKQTLLIFGTDDYLVDAAARKTVDALVPPDQRAFGLDTIDGTADTVAAAIASVARCLEALQTVGFMGSAKVVWFKNVNFLTDTVVGRSEDVKARVGELAALIKGGLPEGVRLVISAGRVDKRYAFYKACRATAELHEYSIPEKAQHAERHALDFLKSHLEGAGIAMGAGDMRFFVERVGTDTRQLVMETEKLQLFLGDRKRVTREDIEHVCATVHDALLWDLTDAFGDRNLPKALRVARNLMFQKQNVIGILCVLETRIRDLMLYREALNRRWLTQRGKSATWGNLPPEAEELLGQSLASDPRSTHPFRVGLLAGQAARYSMRELGRCLQATVRAHESLVSSAAPPQVVLDTLLVAIMGRPKTAKSAR